MFLSAQKQPSKGLFFRFPPYVQGGFGMKKGQRLEIPANTAF
jgi:hypothetical protein